VSDGKRYLINPLFEKSVLCDILILSKQIRRFNTSLRKGENKSDLYGQIEMFEKYVENKGE
jgi:hypothetical protein